MLENASLNFISEVKEKIRSAQYSAMKAVNVELINLYWEIGKSISEKQSESWGKSIVPTLSVELQKEFPGVGGFSVGNLWLMAQFYTEYQQFINLVPLVREISWSKHTAILKKCKNPQEREFYILSTKKFGWTKNVLINQIENKTFERFLLNQTNFEQTLPEKVRNQAILAVKDIYNFDFLEISDYHSEKDLEQKLVQNIRNFLTELGSDFTFLGNQYRIFLDDKEYFIDLLLYHRSLQSLVAVELKVGEFLPEYKGKMEFYLNILNDKVKLPHENEAIGIIICKEKNRTVVEYSLKTGNQPIGVSTYKTTPFLPDNYQKFLPDNEDLSKKIEEFINAF